MASPQPLVHLQFIRMAANVHYGSVTGNQDVCQQQQKKISCHLSAVSAACEVLVLPTCFHICFINAHDAFFPVPLPSNSHVFGFLHAGIWKHH